MINKAVYCKNCGFVSTECDVKKGICPVCKNKLYKTQEGAGYFGSRIEKSMPTWEDVVRHKYLKNVTLDKDKSTKRSNIEQRKQQEELVKLKGNTNKTESKQFIPKCPTCGSTNVQKISTSKKIFGGVMFGLFSSDVRNSMSCNNCGYKW